MKRILLLRTWLSNIGNGFIEKGAVESLQRSLNDIVIIETSSLSDLVGYSLGRRDCRARIQRIDKVNGILPTSNFINVSQFIDEIDAVVIPGCVLDIPRLRTLYPTLKYLKEKGFPISFLGAGGKSYDSITKSSVTKILNKIEPHALLTRDVYAYEAYGGISQYAHRGIDCAFFINDWYNPPRSSRRYVLMTFDFHEEPDIDPMDMQVVRTTHSPLFFAHFHNPLVRMPLKIMSRVCGGFNEYRHSILKKEGVVLSDLLTDYLFLYANAEMVYTDRVHACVATLAYGGRARLFSDTVRAGLFQELLDEDITERLVSLDEDYLLEKKEEQLSAIKECFEAL